MVNCNDSQLKRDGDTIKVTGLPTDGALKVLAEKIYLQMNNCWNTSGDPEQEIQNYVENKICTQQFTRKRKGMSVLCQKVNGEYTMYIKGAPEVLVEQSNRIMLQDGQIVPFQNKKEILKIIEQTASKGLRTLGLCVKEENELGDFK